MVSSVPGAGVPSLLVDATNHQDDLVVGDLLVHSQVAQALLNPIHVQAVGPILLVGVDPTHRVEGGVLGPILLVVLVAIPLEGEGPSHQVEVAPILRVVVVLEAGAPIHLVVEGPILVGPCRKVGRLRLGVPVWFYSVLVPSCSHGSCELQTMAD